MNKQKYFWVAILDDDSIIMEFNPDGTENSYQNLPRERVKFFGLQGPKDNYILDLFDGKVIIQNSTNPNFNKNLDIKIPLKNGLFQINGPLSNNQRYEFSQWKQGYTDFNLAAQSSVNVIEKHILGWKKIHHFQTYGPCLVEMNISIEPLKLASSPEMQIIVRNDQGGNPILGSPFKVNLG
jgi:hypothetical protein